MPAASTLVWEVLTNGQVEAYLNDVQFVLTGCTTLHECTVAEAFAGLEAKSSVDAKTTCNLNDSALNYWSRFNNFLDW